MSRLSGAFLPISVLTAGRYELTHLRHLAASGELVKSRLSVQIEIGRKLDGSCWTSYENEIRSDFDRWSRENIRILTDMFATGLPVDFYLQAPRKIAENSAAGLPAWIEGIDYSDHTNY